MLRWCAPALRLNSRAGIAGAEEDEAATGLAFGWRAAASTALPRASLASLSALLLRCLRHATIALPMPILAARTLAPRSHAEGDEAAAAIDATQLPVEEEVAPAAIPVVPVGVADVGAAAGAAEVGWAAAAAELGVRLIVGGQSTKVQKQRRADPNKPNRTVDSPSPAAPK
jgi:hypothetical protein